MEKQLPFDKGTINYTVKGNGPAVVFLHGFLEDLSIWDDFSDRLSSKYRVVSIDLPGFGKSSVFSTNHTMELMAESVNHVLLSEKISVYMVVGHSMGGYVALALAELFPEKIKGVVLFHSHAGEDDENGKINRNRAIEVVKQNHKDFINGFIPLMFAAENVTVYSKEISRLKELASSMNAEGVIAALAGMRDRKDLRGLLETIEVPIFFIVGKNDSRIPPEKILPQISLPKNSEALLLDQVGHMGFIEAKEITLLALEHFFDRNFFLLKHKD